MTYISNHPYRSDQRDTQTVLSSHTSSMLHEHIQKTEDILDIKAFQNKDFSDFIQALQQESEKPEPQYTVKDEKFVKVPQTTLESTTVLPKPFGMIQRKSKYAVSLLLFALCCGYKIKDRAQSYTDQIERVLEAHHDSWLLKKASALSHSLSFVTIGRSVEASTQTPSAPTSAMPSSPSNPQKKDKTVANKIQFDPLAIETPKEIETLAKVAEEREKIFNEEKKLKKKEMTIALMKKELNTKIAEMQALKASIDQSLMQANKQEKFKLDRFIKIIEGMKTKNAASVMDRLDPVVLKELVPQMNPKKISAILDQMSPAKAKEVLQMTVSDKNPYAKQ